MGARMQRLLHDSQAENATILIVALGDSVTRGSTRAGILDLCSVWHQMLKQELASRYPKTVFNVLNAGVGGDTAKHALARLERGVLSHRPDVVLVGFGLNDAGAGREGLQEFHASMTATVQRIRESTGADVLLLTPNWKNTSDNPQVTEEHRKLGLAAKMAEQQNKGIMAAYAQVIRQVGDELAVPVADVYAQWQRLHDEGRNTNDLLANGLNHPNAEGHRIAAACVLGVIHRCLLLD